LIKLVAICAVFFALLRTPGAPLIVAIGFVLIGFAVDRAKGGMGIRGGTLGGCIGFFGIGISECVHFYPVPRFDMAILWLAPSVGFVAGTVISIALHFIVTIINYTWQHISREPLTDDSCGPI
jgi:hypothetical protein